MVQKKVGSALFASAKGKFFKSKGNVVNSFIAKKGKKKWMAAKLIGRKPPFERRAPIMDMKGKLRRTGMALRGFGKVFGVRKHKF